MKKTIGLVLGVLAVVAFLPFATLAIAQTVDTKFNDHKWSAQAGDSKQAGAPALFAGIRSRQGDTFACWHGGRADIPASSSPYKCSLAIPDGQHVSALKALSVTVDGNTIPIPDVRDHGLDAPPRGSWIGATFFVFETGDELLHRFQAGSRLVVTYALPSGKQRAVEFSLDGAGTALEAAMNPRSPSTARQSASPKHHRSALPKFSKQLDGGNEVRVRNPNDFAVAVGVRSGDGGKDFEVPANGINSVYLSDGRYDIYFVYSDKPEALFQGDSFTLKDNGVEIQIVKVVNGNYNIRQVK